MEKTSQAIRYLLYEEIVNLNRKIIVSTGGYQAPASVVSNPNSLQYLIEIVHSNFNDEEIYRSLFEKAAIYAFNIITRHIFFDGNKRTGMASAILFLRLNGLSFAVSNDEIVEFSVRVADGKENFSSVAKWLEERTSD